MLTQGHTVSKEGSLDSNLGSLAPECLHITTELEPQRHPISIIFSKRVAMPPMVS